MSEWTNQPNSQHCSLRNVRLLLLSNFSCWILPLSICSKLSGVFWIVTSTLKSSDSEIARFYPFHSIPNATVCIQIQACITKASAFTLPCNPSPTVFQVKLSLTLLCLHHSSQMALHCLQKAQPLYSDIQGFQQPDTNPHFPSHFIIWI